MCWFESLAEKAVAALLPTPPTPATAAAISSASGALPPPPAAGVRNLSEAWEILHNPTRIRDGPALTAPLDELGVMSEADLGLLETEYYLQMAGLLKAVGAKIFKTALLLQEDGLGVTAFTGAIQSLSLNTVGGGSAKVVSAF